MSSSHSEVLPLVPRFPSRNEVFPPCCIPPWVKSFMTAALRLSPQHYGKLRRVAEIGRIIGETFLIAKRKKSCIPTLEELFRVCFSHIRREKIDAIVSSLNISTRIASTNLEISELLDFKRRLYEMTRRKGISPVLKEVIVSRSKETYLRIRILRKRVRTLTVELKKADVPPSGLEMWKLWSEVMPILYDFDPRFVRCLIGEAVTNGLMEKVVRLDAIAEELSM